MGKWGVWCTVSGGVTGTREAWLKANGQRVEYETKAEAEAEANRLRGGTKPFVTQYAVARYGGGVTFTYTAREIDA